MPENPPATATLRVREAFPPVPTAAWDAAIQHDLQGADFEKKLVWRPEDGLAIRPYYRREDLDPLAGQVATAPGHFPFVRPASSRWAMVVDWAPPAHAIRADEWHDAGASTVQEVGLAVAAGVDRLAHLTGEGTSAPDAAGGIEFAFAVGSAYFLEIAKLRAVRMLWAQACAAFGVDDERASMRMHVRTSRANKSVYDPYTNLLRVTTEALAAVLGGCQRLTVEPFGFDPHLAQNVQRILQEEAYLDVVADPGGGAYYIEALTDAVAREAWSLFQGIEAQGGHAAALRAGTVQTAIEASRLRKARAVSSRRRTLVGVNTYPNLTDREPADVPAALRTGWRMAEPFERIRERTARHAAATGRVPMVLLLTRGDVKMRTARANFSFNFFGCAGFDIAEADQVTDRAADLVLLCSSDAEYLALAQEVCPRVSVPVLVAGNPAGQAEALRAAGVQGFVHLGSDAVETLTHWQDRLGMDA